MVVPARQARLERRPLGNTGIDVSVLGLGTVKLGRTANLKYPSSFDLPSDDAVVELLNAARELGINLIDTAPAYGSAERRLGELLPGPREDWVLASKVGEQFDGKQSSYDFSPEACEASVFASLARLKTDYLDIVLVHSDGRDAEIVESMGTLDALANLKTRGVVRAIGLSGKSADGGRIALPRVDVLMATIHAGYDDEIELVREAGERGVGVLIKKALNSGRGSPEQLPPIAELSGVCSIIVGTRSAEHLRADAAAINGTGAIPR